MGTDIKEGIDEVLTSGTELAKARAHVGTQRVHQAVIVKAKYRERERKECERNCGSSCTYV
jgi:hypothetical protein